MMNRLKNGFTLIELLVVLTIIAILAIALLPNLLNVRRASQDGAARTFLRHCVTAMEMTRDPLGYVSNAKSCDDKINLGQAAQILPSSVSSTKVETNSNLSDYTIEVTSITGKVFKYDKGFLSSVP